MRLLLFCSLALTAHDLGVTGVQVRIDGGQTFVRIQSHIDQLQGRDPATELPKRLRLRLDGAYFEAQGKVTPPQVGTGIVAWEGSRSGVPQSIVIDAPLFPEDAMDRTLVTLMRNGVPAGEAILGATSNPVVLGEEGSAALRRF